MLDLSSASTFLNFILKQLVDFCYIISGYINTANIPY